MFSQFLTEEIQRFIDQQNINKDHFKLKKKKSLQFPPSQMQYWKLRTEVYDNLALCSERFLQNCVINGFISLPPFDFCFSSYVAREHLSNDRNRSLDGKTSIRVNNKINLQTQAEKWGKWIYSFSPLDVFFLNSQLSFAFLLLFHR